MRTKYIGWANDFGNTTDTTRWEGAEMSRELWYLCRLNWNGKVIRLPERDYNWMNNLAIRRNKLDGKSDLELLAKGYEKEVIVYYELINGKGLTNVS